MASGATPVWPISLTAVRASAASRGAASTWSAMRRSVGMSGTPWLRARSPRSRRQACGPVSLTAAVAATPGRAQSRRPGRTAASRQRSGDIRAWAKDHGMAVSERGRIPADVVAQYQAAQGR